MKFKSEKNSGCLGDNGTLLPKKIKKYPPILVILTLIMFVCLLDILLRDNVHDYTVAPEHGPLSIPSGFFFIRKENLLVN